MQQIGDNIKHHRRLRGWTQTDLASRLQVHRSTVERWENRGVVPLRVLQGIADVLNVEVMDLLKPRKLD